MMRARSACASLRKAAKEQRDIYFSEGSHCLCIYLEEVPEYGLRGQRVDVFVSVLLEALGREVREE